jgi:hypothetical protein
MNNDYEFLNIKGKCQYCTVEYIHHMPNDCCNNCFFDKKIKPMLSKKPKNNWEGRKRFAIYVFFTIVPFIIIGLIYGIKVQWIVMICVIYGQLIDGFINWLMRKF